MSLKLTKEQIEMLLSAVKECSRCGEFKLKTGFGEQHNASWCYECIREFNTISRKKRKLKVIEGYGGKCECCGEINWEFLTIDHLNKDGTKHKKELGGAAYLYPFLIKNNYPKDNYRLLCFNCNCSIGSFGYCPHQKQLKLVVDN